VLTPTGLAVLRGNRTAVVAAPNAAPPAATRASVTLDMVSRIHSTDTESETAEGTNSKHVCYALSSQKVLVILAPNNPRAKPINVQSLLEYHAPCRNVLVH
jgi:histidinol-phosphate/aromatic aminotransferase/cobyric acid decarboxylase-like protein